MKKLKTYILTVSKKFPVTHKRKGESTGFVSNIGKDKIHTIRAKYDTWKKRIDEVNAGEAILKVVNWSDKPYNSKQETIVVYDQNSGIGVQKLTFFPDYDGERKLIYPVIDDLNKTVIKTISNNDGLDFQDFEEWFKNYDLSEPMAIIHFTKFRY